MDGRVGESDDEVCSTNGCGLVFALFMASFSLQAADRTKAIAFMEVTGFDVSLRSMRVSAADAPAMLGLDAEDFGLSWSRLADEIFEPTQIEQDALAHLRTRAYGTMC